MSYNREQMREYMRKYRKMRRDNPLYIHPKKHSPNWEAEGKRIKREMIRLGLRRNDNGK